MSLLGFVLGSPHGMVNRNRRNKLRQNGLSGTFLSITGGLGTETRNADHREAERGAHPSPESAQAGHGQRVEGSSIAATCSRIGVRPPVSGAFGSGVSVESRVH